MTLSRPYRSISIVFLLLLFAVGTAFAQSGPTTTTPKTLTAPKKLTVQDKELKQFASTLKDLQAVQLKFQKDFKKAVSDSPLSEKRFVQIYQSEKSTNKMPADMTAAETKQYQQLVGVIVAMERKIQQEMITTVKKDGFTVSRFNAIVQAVHADPALADRLKKLR